ncbi:hypothetical protein IWX46DRAFT_557603, partial [Phyllosticta citricarpa]
MACHFVLDDTCRCPSALHCLLRHWFSVRPILKRPSLFFFFFFFFFSICGSMVSGHGLPKASNWSLASTSAAN